MRAGRVGAGLILAALLMPVAALTGCAGPDHAPVVSSPVTAAAPAPSHASGAPQPSQPTAAETDSGASSRTYIPECLADNFLEKPTSMTLSCADSNESLDGLAWSGWGQERATATGQIVTNTCTPNCAQGKLERFPVQVTADRLSRREASQIYTTVTVTYTGARPAGTQQTQTYPLPTVPN